MKLNHLIMFCITLSFATLSIAAEQSSDVRHVSGEINWIDTKLGKLQLKTAVSPTMSEITEYRINQNDTRVTNPTDKKFFTIEDLQPGQHVTIDVINGKEENIVEKITSDPRPISDFQEAYGHIEAVDALAGTLTLARRPHAGQMEENAKSYFIFNPKDITVMQSTSSQPVELVLKQGDVVKVEFVFKDDKQQARSITLYSPKVTSTTTTTTVTTTQ